MKRPQLHKGTEIFKVYKRAPVTKMEAWVLGTETQVPSNTQVHKWQLVRRATSEKSAICHIHSKQLRHYRLTLNRFWKIQERNNKYMFLKKRMGGWVELLQRIGYILHLVTIYRYRKSHVSIFDYSCINDMNDWT